MKIILNIDYRTNWGESVYVTGDTHVLGSGNLDAAKPMQLTTGERWVAEIDVPDTVNEFKYAYFVRHESGAVKREWGKPRVFCRGNGVSVFNVYDRWQDQPWDKPYYSSVFTECECRHGQRQPMPVCLPDTVTIRVSAPMVKEDETVAICGNNSMLGNWNPEKAVRMNDHNYPEWSVSLDRRAISADTQFKFVIVNKKTGAVVDWEGGDTNRTVESAPREGVATVFQGLRLINPRNHWRGAGVAIPVFSVRSNDDFGVGDFFDLKKVIDWAEKTGQKFLQILPINDTTMTHTWVDSYPYNANSTFALHPMYMRLSELGKLKDKGRQKYYDDLARELNQLKEVDYERVNDGKNSFMREIYAQEGAKVVASREFADFVKQNESWLPAYAAFCVLRDRNHTPDFSHWGEYAAFSREKLAKFIKENDADIKFVYYVQFNLAKQMQEVHEYANAKGVSIKGDIPIGISRTSVDAWTDSRLFNMDCQAGAPPDDFSVLGQNWGFPTYNWEEMNRDGFAWWKNRFKKMSQYFNAYRIDHVLGFFRIWQIPMDAVHGLLGIFNPALPFTPDELRYNYDFWIDVDLQTTPYIMDYFLGDFFGEYTDEARSRFLVDAGYGRYKLREQFNTQRKVADYFAGEEKNEKNTRLSNALMGLIDDVLFIEDPYEKGKYHPRISAQYTYIYRSLNDYERWCFDRLYNDFFYHRHNDFWYGKAMWKLPPLIDETDMLVCAEDLGMIPDCVPAVLGALQILSLEIQRMPKDPKVEFGNTWDYPYLSVCTTSTHDMGGIRQWWEENREKTQHYYNNVLHQSGTAPYYAEPWICDRIIDMHLKSPSMLCILPLQDILSMDGNLRREDPREETINVPANPRHYWRYRMHINIEDLLAAEAFNGYLRDKIAESGR